MTSEAVAHAIRKRVLIIHGEGNTFSNPSLKCIIDLLLEKGCQIDLRYLRSNVPMPQVTGIRFLPYGGLTRRIKSLALDRICSWNAVFIGVMLEHVALYGKYDLILGIDRQGLVESSALHKLTGTPCAFVSFEIMFESETSSRYKRIEREAAGMVSMWMVQDEARARHLQAENGLPEANRLLLPLASAGAGMLNARRLRDQLHIPAGKKVAIVIGSITDWAMTGRILASVAGWPEDWVLIVHERHGATGESLRHEIAAVEPLIGRRIFISDTAVDMVDDLGSVLAGVSAGLAFYKPTYTNLFTGRNLEHLGAASGKISTYLRYGIPVILNEIGLYSDEARQFGFGRVAQAPEQIATTLEQIGDERHGSAARQYFLEKLDFNVHRDRIWSGLQKLMASGQRIVA